MQGKNRFATSFIVGLLALPLAAAGATALVASRPPRVEQAVPLAASAITIPEISVPTTTVPEPPPEDTEALAVADVEQACGPAGQDLVDRESRSELSDLEQAALDALRAVCETEGLALPGPPAPAPVIRTVTVDQAPANVVASVSSSSVSSADHEDDEDEDHEQDEPEQEDHEEDEPEDDGHDGD